MTASSAQSVTPGGGTHAGGTRIGRYRLCDKLAAGGMASVYLSRMEGPYGFEKLVAIKLIHPHLALKSSFIEMFLDEARLASRISHPNVTSVIDFGQHGGTYYLAMDYIFGETLVDTCRQLIPRPEMLRGEHWQACAARIIADAAEGLHAAHELRDEAGNLLNVVHRDVSPDNIFVTFDGVVKVVDFGVARAEGQIHQTKAGTIKGKYAYMAPEMLKPEGGIDRRADVWALGVVLWELLTCKRLFKRESEPVTLIAVNSDPIEPPSALVPSIPLALDTIAMRALQRDRDQRYRDARALSRDLKRFVAERAELIDTPEIGELMATLHPEERERKLALMDRARTMSWHEGSSQIMVAQSGAGARSSAELLAPASEGQKTLVPGTEMPAAWPAGSGAGGPRVAGPYSATAAAVRPRRSGAGVAFALVLLVLIAAGVGVWLLREPGGDQAGAAIASTAGEPGADAKPAPAVAGDAGPTTGDGDGNGDGDGDGEMAFQPDPVRSPPRDSGRRPRLPDQNGSKRGNGGKTGDSDSGDGGKTGDGDSGDGDSDDGDGDSDDGDGGDSKGSDDSNGAGGPGATISLDGPIAKPRVPDVPVREPPKPPPKLILDARTKIASLTARGSLPRSKVERAVERVQARFRDCYRTASRGAKRDAKTRVAVSLTIDEQGFAQRVSASGGTLPGLATCVRDAARTIRSREPPDVGSVAVKFNVEFTPGK